MQKEGPLEECSVVVRVTYTGGSSLLPFTAIYLLALFSLTPLCSSLTLHSALSPLLPISGTPPVQWGSPSVCPSLPGRTPNGRGQVKRYSQYAYKHTKAVHILLGNSQYLSCSNRYSFLKKAKKIAAYAKKYIECVINEREGWCGFSNISCL